MAEEFTSFLKSYIAAWAGRAGVPRNRIDNARLIVRHTAVALEYIY